MQLWLVIVLTGIMMAGSYLLGGVMPALFLSKKMGGFDIREKGSGNAGTTNMLRVMGWRYGLITFAFDALKGALPPLIAKILFYHIIVQTASGSMQLGNIPAYLVAAAVLLGHAFPMFYHFKGGKAVASSVGVLLVLSPWLSLVVIAVCISIMFITKRVSIGSLIACIVFPILAFTFPSMSPDRIFPWFLLVLCLFVIFMHRSNIKRLMKGQEKAIVPGKGK